MSSLIRQIEAESGSRRRVPWLVIGSLMATAAAFLLIPGDLASKSHAALHGLCAQRPSHSFRLGENIMPMDARMTGIYFGAATTLIWLAVSGRLRAAGPIPLRVVIVLAAGVALMALDGFNALMMDLKMRHPYEPHNALRYVTGGLAGAALGVGLGYLFAITIWQRSDRTHAMVDSLWQFLSPLAAMAVVGAILFAGLEVAYAPLAIGMVAASVGVFWVLSTVLVALLSSRAWAHESYDELTGVASAGLLLALVVVAVLAGLRFAAEAYVGLPTLP